MKNKFLTQNSKMAKKIINSPASQKEESIFSTLKNINFVYKYIGIVLNKVQCFFYIKRVLFLISILSITNTLKAQLNPDIYFDSIKQFEIGTNTNSVLTNKGNVYFWGDVGLGQSGSGQTNKSVMPVMSMVDSIEQVFLGGDHVMFIDNKGKVWVSGYNNQGQLGLGDRKGILTPQELNIPNEKITKVSLGYDHSIFLTEGGKVFTTGNNMREQLGLGNNAGNFITTPTQITSLSNIKDIETSSVNSIAIDNNDNIYIWGSNRYGQLSNGSTLEENTPYKTNITGVKQILGSISYARIIILKDDSTVVGVGSNSSRELLNGNTTGTGSGGYVDAIDINNKGKVKYISLSLNNTYVILKNGEIWVNGYNRKGQLGDGTNTNSTGYAPQEISDNIYLMPGDEVVEIKGGYDFTYIRTKKGYLYRTGNNEKNQLAIENIKETGNFTVMGTLSTSGFKRERDGDIITVSFKIDKKDIMLENGKTKFSLEKDPTKRTQDVFYDLESVHSRGNNVVIKFSIEDMKSLERYKLFEKEGFQVFLQGQLNIATDLLPPLNEVDIAYSDVIYFDSIFGYSIQGNIGIISKTKDVWVMGSNSQGQLGVGNKQDIKDYPVMSIIDKVSKIDFSNGGLSSYFLKEDGTAWSVGYNGHGQLGDGTTAAKNIPVKIKINSKVKDLSSGVYSLILVALDGAIWSVGYNSFGELGDGTTSGKIYPQRTRFNNNPTIIKSGYHIASAVVNGMLYNWGYNSHGQIGNGSKNSISTPYPAMVNVIQISSSKTSPVITVLKTDSTVVAAGSNNYGQLFNKTSGQIGYVSATDINSKGKIKQISTYRNNTAALLQNGEVWINGYNYEGQLGNGTFTNIPNYEPVETSKSILLESGEKITEVKVGGTYIFYRTNLNNLYKVGGNLGIKSRTKYKKISSLNPSNFKTTITKDGILEITFDISRNGIELDKNKIKYTLGQTFTERTQSSFKPLRSINILHKTVKMTIDMSSYLKGDSFFFRKEFKVGFQGQLNMSIVLPPIPVDIEDVYAGKDVIYFDSIKQFKTGTYNSSLLTNKGNVYSWGGNKKGQLGIGSVKASQTMPVMSMVDSIEQVFVGAYHSIFIDYNGQYWVVGSNDQGQLGLGNKISSNVPQKFNISNKKIIKISTNWYHSMFLTKGGKVFSWGLNTSGELGLGNTSSISTPTQIRSLKNIKDIKAGINISTAIDNSGNLYIWGSNYSNQIPINPRIVSTPHKTSITGIIKQVVDGASMSRIMILKDDSTVVGAGVNSNRQLLNGITTNTPKRGGYVDAIDINNKGKVKYIYNGYYNTYAILKNGEIWVNGYNKKGQLGDGTNTSSTGYAPQEISDNIYLTPGDEVVEVKGGDEFTYIRTKKGYLYRAGNNNLGQLATGNTMDKNYFTVMVSLNPTDFKRERVGEFIDISFKSDKKIISVDSLNPTKTMFSLEKDPIKRTFYPIENITANNNNEVTIRIKQSYFTNREFFSVYGEDKGFQVFFQGQINIATPLLDKMKIGEGKD